METLLKIAAGNPQVASIIFTLLALIGLAVVVFAIKSGKLPFLPQAADGGINLKDMMDRFLDNQDKTATALVEIAQGNKQMAEAWQTVAQVLKDNGDKLDNLRESIQKGQERLHDRVDKALEAAARD